MRRLRTIAGNLLVDRPRAPRLDGRRAAVHLRRPPLVALVRHATIDVSIEDEHSELWNNGVLVMREQTAKIRSVINTT